VHAENGGIPQASNVSTNVRKRGRRADDSDSSEGYTTDKEEGSSKRREAASGKRGQKKNVAQRQSALEADEWVKVGTVETNKVTCKGCNKPVRIHPSRQYDDANWQAHKTKCPGVTGFVKKRVLDGKISKAGKVGERLHSYQV
jgi:hypothetical protein